MKLFFTLFALAVALAALAEAAPVPRQPSGLRARAFGRGTNRQEDSAGQNAQYTGSNPVINQNVFQPKPGSAADAAEHNRNGEAGAPVPADKSLSQPPKFDQAKKDGPPAYQPQSGTQRVPTPPPLGTDAETDMFGEPFAGRVPHPNAPAAGQPRIS